MGHHDGCHDMMFDRLIEFFTKMTRRDRRHKSVRDGSRRVWEAMRRVLPGLTTGSGTHRSRYENRDERRGWFVRPSVVLSAWRIKMTAKIRTTRRYIIDNNMHFAIPHRFRIVWAEEQKKWGQLFIPFIDGMANASLLEAQTQDHLINTDVVVTCCSICSHCHCHFDSPRR